MAIEPGFLERPAVGGEVVEGVGAVVDVEVTLGGRVAAGDDYGAEEGGEEVEDETDEGEDSVRRHVDGSGSLWCVGWVGFAVGW